MSETQAPVIPPDVVALADYERHARERLPASTWAYVAGAGADGITRRWNREAFDALRLEGRVFGDMRGASTATRVLGIDMAAPIILAPVAFQKLAHPDGELATVVGAGATSTVMTVSTQASCTIEEIAAAAHAPLWFQLYMSADRGFTRSLLRRAEESGYRAIVVTADAPVNGVRNDEQRAGFALSAGVAPVNLQGAPALKIHAGPGESPVFRGLLVGAPTWDDLAWLCAETSLPVLVKGIVSPSDAERTCDLGAAGIVVSNHGGRTLDTLPASIEALPAIADRVAGRLPLILDGGVRRGTDILKAIALGASAVMVGQPIMHGLAAAGATGVAHIVAILKAELEVAMALTGRATIAGIDETVLWKPRPK
jgi:4-hydroxymandelate oxidase